MNDLIARSCGRRWARGVLALAGWLGCVVPGLAATNYRPQVGQPHPDFVLPRIDTRQPVSLSQFRGKKVLLVHFASW